MLVSKSQKCKNEHLGLILALFIRYVWCHYYLHVWLLNIQCGKFDCNKYDKWLNICVVFLPGDPIAFAVTFK